MSFADRLKELRTEHSFSQREAAQLIGASPSQYCKWENGECFPRPEFVRKIAEAYSVLPKWLEIGQGYRTQKEADEAKAEAERRRRDEKVTSFNIADEQRLKDITTCIQQIKSMDIPKERKRSIHRTLSGYRTELEQIVYFGEVR